MTATANRPLVLKERLNLAGGRLGEEGLIRFDHRSLLLLGFLLAAFILCVAFNISGSSIAIWDQKLPQPSSDNGLLLGSPEEIRSDEWLVFTPYVISQYQHGYPVQNTNVGTHEDTLLMSLPVKHFSTAFRPYNWGYFTLGVERGFSFFWCYRVFGLLAASFLLMMLVTRSNFWLSAGGALWLFLSGYIQWWFSTIIPETVIAFILVFIATVYILISRKAWQVVIAWLLLVLFGVNFVIVFYPPFQIVLGFLLTALLAGFLLDPENRQRLWRRFPVRVVAVVFAGIIVAVVMGFFYRDTRQTIESITNTIYPGKRVAVGGTVGIAHLFSGFTGVPWNEDSLPSSWNNASEASNFILLFPVVMLVAAWNRLRNRRSRLLVGTLSIYLLALTVWTLVKIPAIVARISLLSYVPPQRALLGLGIGSVLLVMIYLAGSEESGSEEHGGKPEVAGSGDPDEAERRREDKLFYIAASMLAFVALLTYAVILKRDTGDFFRFRYLLPMAAVFAVISYTLLSRRKLAFMILILLATLPNIRTHPVMAGMGAIFNQDVYKEGVAVKDQSPGSRWLVYGNIFLSSFLKTSGLDIANGYQYTPDMEFFRHLDPDGNNQNVYNRYSLIVFLEPGLNDLGEAVSADAGAPSSAGAVFTLFYQDRFAVTVDPCAPALREAGITNFAFSYRPDESRFSCLEQMAGFNKDGAYFYQRKK